MIAWSPGMSLEAIECLIINKAVAFYGSEEKAAGSLKITFKELRRKLVKYKEDNEKIAYMKEKKEREEAEFIARARGILPSVPLTPERAKQESLSR